MDTAHALWQPSPRRIEATQMRSFLLGVAKRHGIPAEWEALRQWSIDRRADFWNELAAFAGVHFSRPATQVLEGDGMLGTRWFVGARLNYARHMLRWEGDEPAILSVHELGAQGRCSRSELRDEVARAQAALRQVGVQSGDRVAALMPNVPETIVLMLAAASLGAIWSSCSPDFGVQGVLDRFGQIEPSVLLTTDGYTYAAKPFDTLERVRDIQSRLPSLKKTIVVPYLSRSPDLTKLQQSVLWREFLGPLDRAAPPLSFHEVAFEHPLFILYSSGTTGVPKCIVHGHGGTLLQHMKELMLHSDLRAGERIFYFTTCGWMMWNWLVSGLGAGATVVLYEGNPAHPTIHALWELAARLKVNLFGTSPKFLAACQKAHITPGREHDLSALRCLLSTGSPLSAEQFHWVYEHVKSDLQLSSISGGTDIVSCFMLGNPILPVYEGEIQCRGLGMDVQAWEEDGRPVVGRKGELVCASAFPSQPVCFWKDPDGSRYRSAYFEHYPGVWRHGDFVEITPRGGVIVYGRSDATLNPGGVRIGTAEIYRIVEGIPEVLDCLVIGRDFEEDVEIVLFVVLREGAQLAGGEGLEKKIRDAIARGATRRHVPKHIRQVRAIPYTISGKKVELAVQRVLAGQEVKNKDALADPTVLDEYRSMRL